MRIALAGLSTLICLAAAPARAELTLEQIMADPDWIGAPVEQAYWAADGSAVYYRLKRAGSPLRDLHRVALGDGGDTALAPAAPSRAWRTSTPSGSASTVSMASPSSVRWSTTGCRTSPPLAR